MKDGIDYMEDEMAKAFPKPWSNDHDWEKGWRAACEAMQTSGKWTRLFPTTNEPPFKIEEDENAALRTALADAISSPMGVVPASAEQFYDATKGTVKA